MHEGAIVLLGATVGMMQMQDGERVGTGVTLEEFEDGSGVGAVGFTVGQMHEGDRVGIVGGTVG